MCEILNMTPNIIDKTLLHELQVLNTSILNRSRSRKYFDLWETDINYIPVSAYLLQLVYSCSGSLYHSCRFRLRQIMYRCFRQSSQVLEIPLCGLSSAVPVIVNSLVSHILLVL